MADLKISQLGAISILTPATDVLPVVDSGGVTKKITTNQILGSGGTATLASATITGDLTVRTTGLILNTSGLGVGISPTSFGAGYGTIQVSGATGSGIKMGSPTNGSFIYSDNTWLNILTETNIPHRFFVNNIIQHTIEQLGVFSWKDGAGGTRMTLNATGLGVGAVPSIAKLELQSVTDTLSLINSTNTVQGNRAALFMAARNANGNVGNVSIEALSVNNQQNDLVFRTGSTTMNGFGTERMRIDTFGNVGIGVTPTAIFGGSGVNGKGLQGDSWTISSLGGSNDTYFGSNLYTSAYGVWSNRVNAASGAYYITGGTHIFYRGAAQAPGTITPTESARIDASGNLILQPSSTPPSLFANGQLTMNATSNTNLRFSYRGSDGITRVANITLA